jgi:hypothetical protein
MLSIPTPSSDQALLRLKNNLHRTENLEPSSAETMLKE